MIESILVLQTVLLIAILYFVVNRQPRPRSKQAIVTDTSALIDGRIVEIAKVGFLAQQIVVPQFVIDELQLLADGNDTHKRERARFGLDMVQALQTETDIDVVLSKDNIAHVKTTDAKLVAYAKKYSTDLCTTDYNLNKVATIEGIRVLNVNELANAMRPVALPGETKEVKIVQKGSNKNQGVGYLEDGSMVVIEDAARSIGKKVTVQISRYIQTDAGKMLFGRKTTSQHRSRNSR
jgi:uncharacterized protein YacL